MISDVGPFTNWGFVIILFIIAIFTTAVILGIRGDMKAREAYYATPKYRVAVQEHDENWESWVEYRWAFGDGDWIPRYSRRGNTTFFGATSHEAYTLAAERLQSLCREEKYESETTYHHVECE